MHNHNDPTQTSFYIPYEPQDEEPEETWVSAYRISWSKCLTQLQAEIDSLYTPTIDSVLHRLSTVHEDVLPGLPYPELPFIAVHNSSSRFINILLTRLHTNDIRVSHLYPSDEPNISTAMRTLISNLLTARKAKTSRHATYDITLLNEHFTRSDPLLIVLHDFEQFEPSVIQDLLYICSTRLSSLHLTFLVFLSSPPATQGQGSSYIHNTYPRSTLTHLRIHSFSVPCGQPVLEQTLLGTFFNPSFYPGIILGPKVLEGITDYYTRHNGSVDALITGVQLVYLKHFFTEPLSVLTHPPAPLAYDDHILNLLRSRLPAYPDDEDVLELFQRHSISFQSASCDLRLGFTLLHTTMIFLGSKGYKPFPSFSPATSLTMTLMLSVLKGQTTREIKTLTMYMKKLQPQSLERLLESLFENIPLSGYDETRKALRRFITQEDEIDAGEVSVWFSEMLTYVCPSLPYSHLN
jgi:origin recognition complex subunit 3